MPGDELSGIDISESSLVSHHYTWDDLYKVPPVDVILHLAGKAHDTRNTSQAQEYFDINVELTRQIFDYFLESEAKKFIFFSSVKAVADTVSGDGLDEQDTPDPKTAYGQSKLEAERYILGRLEQWGNGKGRPETGKGRQENGDGRPEKVMARAEEMGKWVYILRPAMIHGPGNKGNLNLLYRLVQRGFPWPLGAYGNSRSFVSIGNLAYIIKRLVADPVEAGIYQVADDETLSTNELIGLIGESLGIKTRILKIPKPVVGALAKTGDMLHLPLNSERLKKLTESYRVSNVKLKSALGIEKLPITARQGLLTTLENWVHKFPQK